MRARCLRISCASRHDRSVRSGRRSALRRGSVVPTAAGWRGSLAITNAPAVSNLDGQRGLRGNGCGRARMSSGQCARQSELGEHAAVGEPGDGADAVVFEGEHDHPVGPCDRCLGAGAVAAEGGWGLARVGARRRGAPRRLARWCRNLAIAALPWYSYGSGGMVSHASLVSRSSTASMSLVSTAAAKRLASWRSRGEPGGGARAPGRRAGVPRAWPGRAAGRL